MFLSAAQSNSSGGYTVTLDGGNPVAIDGYTSSLKTNCSITWGAANLTSGPHIVLISTTGQSAAAPVTGDPAASFELDGFM